MADFCELAPSLQAPILSILSAKLPIVSGGHLKNSPFRETSAGDRVRSTRRGRACGETRQILRLGRHLIGNPARRASSSLRTYLVQRTSPCGLSRSGGVRVVRCCKKPTISDVVIRDSSPFSFPKRNSRKRSAMRQLWKIVRSLRPRWRRR